MTPAKSFKQPVSVLVVLHTATLKVALLRRVSPPGFWQSVTGSVETGETLEQAAAREIHEETGIATKPGQLIDWHQSNCFEIRPEWRKRYAADVTHNTEHVFSLCIPEAQPLRLSPAEHDALIWLPLQEAAAKVFSWTNRDAILQLPIRCTKSAD